ncbi:MAG TPA: protein kinase [Gemmatimonadales bacterium]|nr:protein kinase [Gemmatimonadales bacterium]
MTAPVDRLISALGDRYAVERQVGEGGMATVYLARDLKHERQVAIKVLKPELAASIGADRFLREIRVAATLQHPNILGLYDSGEEDGLLYYVMPFIAGESLRDRLDKDQQLPLHDALQITREAAEALHFAHKHGVVHRDIKPENILLMGGHALVADFGIARAVDEAGEKLTQTGMAIGTPHYMSPEQSMGSAHVDARSDIYSLGCVLYELLIGQPPFSGPNAMAIIARHSMETVPSLQVVRPSVPDEVEDAVMRALEKTPADRFQTMQEFIDSLAMSEAEATMTRTAARRAPGAQRRTPTRVTPVGVPARRRTRWVVGGALAALALASGAWAWRHFRSPPVVAGASSEFDPHSIAVLYFQAFNPADSLGYLADGLTEGLIRQLGEVPTLSVISANGVGPYRGDSLAPDSIARILHVGTVVRGGIERRGDQLQVTIRLIDGGSGADFDQAKFDQPIGSVLSIQDSLAGEVARLIRRRLGQAIEVRQQRAGASSAQAWMLVQRAQELRKRAAADLTDEAGATRATAEFASADSLYAAAHAADPRWADPLIGRATQAYQQSRLQGQDPLAAKPWIDKGIAFADSALALEPRNPDALEARGTLRYLGYVLGLATDSATKARTLAQARSDLETATTIRPAQAGAWYILSHLYYQLPGGETDTKLAAQRAYEADAYLSNANQILSRLYDTSYDLEQFVDAARWCDEGVSRFPDDFRFISCQLWIMTTKARNPDVPLAWRLADSVVKMAPEPRRPFERLKARAAVAAVLARAGLADSARHVADGAKGDAEVDAPRDLLIMNAFVHTMLNDTTAAIEALKGWLAANPTQRAALATDNGWWLRDLRSTPQFKALVAAS